MRTLRILPVLMVILALAGVTQAKWPYELHYFDGHMHTTHSDGSGSIEDVKEVAKARGLSAVIITNHTKQIVDIVEWTDIVMQCHQLSDRDILLVPSFEVTGSEGLLCRDHVLAWNVYNPFVGKPWHALAPEEVWQSPENPFGTGPLDSGVIRQWTDWIHRFKGIAVHAHPTGTTQLDYNVDYIELINLSHIKDVANFAQMAGFDSEEAWSLGLLLNSFAVHGDKYLNVPVEMPNPQVPGTTIPLSLQQALYLGTSMIGGFGENSGGAQWLGPNTPQELLDAGAPAAANLNSWDQLLMAYIDGEIDHPIFGCANSDAHNTANTIMKSSHFDNSDVGEAKNGVYIKRKRFSRYSLMKAIKNGNLFATTGPSIFFEINGRMMGETVTLRPNRQTANLEISIDSESPTSILVEVNVIKNGEVIYQADPMVPTFEIQLADEVTEDCYYRVEAIALEMADANPVLGIEPKPRFVYANPIFMKVPAQGPMDWWDKSRGFPPYFITD